MTMSKKELQEISRRQFLRRLGLGSAIMAMSPLSALATSSRPDDPTPGSENRMTYRVQNGTGEAISLLGFGMMRLRRAAA